MRGLVLVVALVIALSACGDSRVFAPITPPPAPGAKQLRVMSYNVNFGIAGDASSIAAIEAAKADLVFLQETNDVWERAIVGTLGARYPHRRFDAPIDWVAGGMGLLSRFPIVSVDKLFAPKSFSYFFAWRVVIDTPLGRLQVFNLHLRPPMSDGGSWVVGYFSTRDDRLREIQYHLEALDPKLPALFVGDFNEEGDGKAVSLLVDRGFADAIGEFQGKKRTWEWTLNGGMTLSFQLDHILHDAHFVPVTAQIVEAGRSDHKPIYADFERIDP